MRLHASGICHSDQNAIEGIDPVRCPVVLGHEGAGVVEAIGPGVTRVAVGDHVALSWAPSCGQCAECRRQLPHLCSTAWPAMGLGGLLDGTSRLSRDGETVYHYSFISSFAEACVLPERSCVPIPPTCRSTSPASSAAPSRQGSAPSGGPPACAPASASRSSAAAASGCRRCSARSPSAPRRSWRST